MDAATAVQDESGAVLAAGAICWRPAAAGAGGAGEVLLIHSAKYGEWTWPKGKLDGAETLPECAVREVREEVGLAIQLGRQLPPTRYRLPDGRPKVVSYWAARLPADGDGSAALAAAPREVDDVAWARPEQARRLLSRPGDLAPLDALTRHDESGELDTCALILLRHAQAQPREAWTGSETDRPLSPEGRRQAGALVGLLGCWGPQLLLCSTWQRCIATVTPFAEATGARVAPKAGLTEAGYRRHPGKVVRHVQRLIASGGGSELICTHRPVLGGAVEALRQITRPAVSVELPGKDPWLATGELLVAHVQRGRDGDRRVIAAERHTPALGEQDPVSPSA